MCGIIGYIGNRKAKPLILEGLKKLEYRGYDSCGISVVENNENKEPQTKTKKIVGRIEVLEKKLNGKFLNSAVGIGHTRWATHGTVTETNAHPHSDSKGEILLVHNGVIENFIELKELLIKEGHKFKSETDTEIIAHLIEKFLDERRGFEDALVCALKLIDGAYALAILYKKEPEKIFVARKSSPLLLGIGKKEFFIASDATPILSHTQKIVYLGDNEIGIISRSKYVIKNLEKVKISKEVKELKINISGSMLDGYETFMLKEIFEQEKTIARAFRGRLNFKNGNAHFGGLNITEGDIQNFEKIILIACGTSWHACLYGKYLFEELVKIPTLVEYASEFRYSNPILNNKTLVVVISQSGETADTLAALKLAKQKNVKTLGLINVVGSTISREVDGGIYLKSGPEIGVASTKAFTSQLVVLYLLAIYLGKIKKRLDKKKTKKLMNDLLKLSRKVKKVLNLNQKVLKIAEKYKDAKNFLFLGRNFYFPIALEGALKLKEISYIHAEGYPAAEMKHGPIALIDKNMPSVFVAPEGRLYGKILSNMQEVKARNGKIIVITTEGNRKIKKIADDVIYIPKFSEYLLPVLSVIPLQLLAYHIARLRGCDVDKPRNLAKSVTVE